MVPVWVVFLGLLRLQGYSSVVGVWGHAMQLAPPCILKPVPEEACVPSLGKVGIFLPSSPCSHQHSRFLSCISGLNSRWTFSHSCGSPARWRALPCISGNSGPPVGQSCSQSLPSAGLASYILGVGLNLSLRRGPFFQACPSLSTSPQSQHTF